jgi:hypothetical protein
VGNLNIDVEQDKDPFLSRIKREKDHLPAKWPGRIMFLKTGYFIAGLISRLSGCVFHLI